MTVPPQDQNKLFQISVKGIAFDEQGRVLLIKDSKDFWELPGGRIEHGEDLENTLVRECMEELGVNARLLDERPFCAWSSIDRVGNWRIMLCYRIAFDSLNFINSEECQEFKFFSKEDIEALQLRPQMKKLIQYL
jgi:8-oxo-dGTP pyrophosphatase MutT (NUDIX family)